MPQRGQDIFQTVTEIPCRIVWRGLGDKRLEWLARDVLNGDIQSFFFKCQHAVSLSSVNFHSYHRDTRAARFRYMNNYGTSIMWIEVSAELLELLEELLEPINPRFFMMWVTSLDLGETVNGYTGKGINPTGAPTAYMANIDNVTDPFTDTPRRTSVKRSFGAPPGGSAVNWTNTTSACAYQKEGLGIDRVEVPQVPNHTPDPVKTEFALFVDLPRTKAYMPNGEEEITFRVDIDSDYIGPYPNFPENDYFAFFPRISIEFGVYKGAGPDAAYATNDVMMITNPTAELYGGRNVMQEVESLILSGEAERITPENDKPYPSVVVPLLGYEESGGSPSVPDDSADNRTFVSIYVKLNLTTGEYEHIVNPYRPHSNYFTWFTTLNGFLGYDYQRGRFSGDDATWTANALEAPWSIW